MIYEMAKETNITAIYSLDSVETSLLQSEKKKIDAWISAKYLTKLKKIVKSKNEYMKMKWQ